jgi:hypothetical protein
MKPIEDIRDIFSMLHDAEIIEWEGNKELLTLTIECKYLAERIDKSFDKFYIDLYSIGKMEFDPWTNPPEVPAIIKTDLHDIFKTKLEMNSADIKDDEVIVTCFQHNTEFDYCGGELTLSCQSIKLFDHRKNEMTVEQLDKICNEYWEECGKILENDLLMEI